MEQVIGTKHVQFRSVVNFMDALGYTLYEQGGGMIFFSPVWKNKHRAYINFNTAVGWHNGDHVDWHSGFYRKPFNVSKYDFTRANASKIVCTAKLQYCKRKKRLICQNNMVKFEDKVYQREFGVIEHDD